jgi:hypothetical protein
MSCYISRPLVPAWAKIRSSYRLLASSGLACIWISSGCTAGSTDNTKADQGESAAVEQRLSSATPSEKMALNEPNDSFGRAEGDSPTVASAASAAIKIEINPPDCEFGKEVEAYIEKAGDAREQSGNGYEGVIDVAPVNRHFRNIKVNYAYVGWETSGLIFDNPVSEVRDAFALAGVKISAEGLIDLGPEANAIAYISKAEDEFADYGKSYLDCGI